MDRLRALFDQFLAEVPRIAGALALLIIGWILAKLFAYFIRRLKVDRLAERLNEVELFDKMNVQIKPSVILSKVVYYLILLLFVVAATDSLELQMVSEQISNLIEAIPEIVKGIIIFIGGVVLASLVKNIIITTTRSLNIPSGKIIANTVFYFLLITVAVSALSQANIAETNFIETNIHIILGGIVVAFGIGYGFASRDVLANLLAGTYTRSKFKIGDEIEVQNLRGIVVDMDATSVTIQSGDRNIIIPQSVIIREKVQVFRPKGPDAPRLEE